MMNVFETMQRANDAALAWRLSEALELMADADRMIDAMEPESEERQDAEELFDSVVQVISDLTANKGDKK